jgi:hypothetical protein
MGLCCKMYPQNYCHLVLQNIVFCDYLLKCCSQLFKNTTELVTALSFELTRFRSIFPKDNYFYFLLVIFDPEFSENIIFRHDICYSFT